MQCYIRYDYVSFQVSVTIRSSSKNHLVHHYTRTNTARHLFSWNCTTVEQPPRDKSWRISYSFFEITFYMTKSVLITFVVLALYVLFQLIDWPVSLCSHAILYFVSLMLYLFSIPLFVICCQHVFCFFTNYIPNEDVVESRKGEVSSLTSWAWVSCLKDKINLAISHPTVSKLMASLGNLLYLVHNPAIQCKLARANWPHSHNCIPIAIRLVLHDM